MTVIMFIEIKKNTYFVEWDRYKINLNTLMTKNVFARDVARQTRLNVIDHYYVRMQMNVLKVI